MSVVLQNFVARSLTQEDVDAWRKLRVEGVTHFPGAFLPDLDELQNISREQDQARLKHNHCFGVFVEPGEMIGIAGLNPYSIRRMAHRAGCGPFFVTQAYQGSGAARVLMEEIIEQARALSIMYLELYVTASNARAVRFYKKCGFQTIARIPNAARMSAQLEDDLFMRLAL